MYSQSMPACAVLWGYKEQDNLPLRKSQSGRGGKQISQKLESNVVSTVLIHTHI